MKRLVAIILTGVMVIGVAVAGNPISATEEVTEETEIIETEKLSEITLPHIYTTAELSKLYSYKEDKRKTDPNIVEFLQTDAWLLMQIARAEGGDTLEGQLWVMGTIVNRQNSDKFPDTVYGIVSAEKQFEVFWTGKYKSADINVNSHLALAQIESGINPTQGAIYFESSSNSDNSWHKKHLTFVKEVEGNLYYK